MDNWSLNISFLKLFKLLSQTLNKTIRQSCQKEDLYAKKVY